MENLYLDGVQVPDYDDQITQVLADEFPNADDEENWMAGGLHDYRVGIENRAGEVYRVIGVSLNEGVSLHGRLHDDLGLRDQVGELEGTRNGYHWLMHPSAET
ncbi:hypothetical protein [Billgrantia gudaonensis]|uniref:Uncharacterized protein n=1 Tax=Billgrantia gudaonensis TaxID=376427 RepID=A0A1G9E225_9GAMM|nr:hypothetical protein [Halomonas gudaonensis]SDK70185.1 hypothetical protein SAMN04487954_1243 [Halomonas gudaonensis]